MAITSFATIGLLHLGIAQTATSAYDISTLSHLLAAHQAAGGAKKPGRELRSFYATHVQ